MGGSETPSEPCLPHNCGLFVEQLLCTSPLLSALHRSAHSHPQIPRVHFVHREQDSHNRAGHSRARTGPRSEHLQRVPVGSGLSCGTGLISSLRRGGGPAAHSAGGESGVHVWAGSSARSPRLCFRPAGCPCAATASTGPGPEVDGENRFSHRGSRRVGETSSGDLKSSSPTEWDSARAHGILNQGPHLALPPLNLLTVRPAIHGGEIRDLRRHGRATSLTR